MCNPPNSPRDLILQTSELIRDGDILLSCGYYNQYRHQFGPDKTLSEVDSMMARLCRPNQNFIPIPDHHEENDPNHTFQHGNLQLQPSQPADYALTALIIDNQSAESLQALLDDLLEQSLGSTLEILVAITTDTAALESTIRPYQDRHTNIGYLSVDISLANQRSQLFNKMVSLANGKALIQIPFSKLDGRDTLRCLVKILDDHPNAVLVYPDCWITEPRSSLGRDTPIGLFRGYPFDPRRLFENCYISPLAVWRRSLHDTLGGFDPNYQTAWFYDFWLRAAVAGELFIHWPEPAGTICLEDSTSMTIKESNQARKCNWPSSQGPLPLVEGSCLIPPEWYPALSLQVKEWPLVSIIVPTFNRPEMLQRAVESIFSQYYPHIDAVVVNDGGSDVEPVLRGRFPNASLSIINLDMHQERSHARNTGIRHAKGQYLGYLDDDDFFYADHVITLARFLYGSGQTVAYTDAAMVYQERVDGTWRTRQSGVIHSADFDRDRLLIENLAPILCFLHHRECIQSCGYFNESLITHEDWEFWIRVAQRYDFKHLARTTAAYTHRSGDPDQTSAGNHHQFLESHKSIYAQFPVGDKLQRQREQVINSVVAGIDKIER